MTEPKKLSHEHALLTAAIQSGVDPYEFSARRLFGVDKATPEQRRCARAVQFASGYGAEPALIDNLLRGGAR